MSDMVSDRASDTASDTASDMVSDLVRNMATYCVNDLISRLHKPFDVPQMNTQFGLSSYRVEILINVDVVR